MEFINLKEDHLDNLVKLYNELFPNAYYCSPLTRKYLEKRLLSSRLFNPSYCFLASENEVPIGFCLSSLRGTSKKDERELCLGLLAVSPHHQRQGAGRKLIQELVRRAINDKKERIFVGNASFGFWPGIEEGWTPAIKFFRKAGFEEDCKRVSMLASLRNFTIPQKYLEREKNLEKKGIIIRKFRDQDLQELGKLDSVKNKMKKHER